MSFDLDWRQRAACIGHSPEMWFPSAGDIHIRKAAVRICRDCPVKRECRAHADAFDERFGIWGAETPKQRNTRRGVTAHRKPVRRRTRDHGTAARYRQHIRDGEKACDACLAAGAQSQVESRARKAAKLATKAAKLAARERYEARFQPQRKRRA